MRAFNVGLFDFSENEYSAEASGIGLKPGEVPGEIGITHRSGVVSRFVFERYQGDIEGNVTSFHYRSVLGKGKVTIFND